MASSSVSSSPPGRARRPGSRDLGADGSPLASWQRVRDRLDHPLVMGAPGIRRTQKEDRERGVDQQHVLHRVAVFLAAITARLLSRILGTPDAPFGAIRPKRGEVDAGAGTAAGPGGLLGRHDQGRRIGSGHPEALGQLCHRPAWGIPQGAQRGAQDHHQDVNPLVSLALAHPEQPPLGHLEGVGLQVDQDKQQPILRRRQGTVHRGRVPTGGARSSIEAPMGYMDLERSVKRRHQLPKLIHGETGPIEHLCGASLEIDEPSRAHGGGFLSSEAQDTINRDELSFLDSQQCNMACRFVEVYVATSGIE